MKGFTLLIFAILIVSCNLSGVKSLGDNFALIESDTDDIFIQYCIDETCNVGIYVVPSKVTEYKFDNDWIIAKSINKDNEVSYWIVNKKFDSKNVQNLHEKILSKVCALWIHLISAKKSKKIRLKLYYNNKCLVLQ